MANVTIWRTASRRIVWLLLACMFPAVLGQFQLQQLKSFGFPERSGMSPRGLLRGSDGKWYGTTRGAGSYDEWGNGGGGGTVFRLNEDGTGHTVLHIFSRAPGEGFAPYAPVIEGRDGALYGTTFSGVTTNGFDEGGGTIFRISKEGKDYKILYRFRYGHRDGYDAKASLLEGTDGVLYGVTRNGGAYTGLARNGRETIFKINKDGTGHTVLHRFSDSRDGQWPEAALIEGSDGVLYGTARLGGLVETGFPDGMGVAFKINKDGSGFTVLHRFTRAQGALPSALVEGSDGTLYGTSIHGGFISQTNNVSHPKAGMGVVFKIQKDGSGYAPIHRFSDVNGEGRFPIGGLLESEGVLYGTTVDGGEKFDFGVTFRVNRDGSDYRVLATLPMHASYVLEGELSPLSFGRDGALHWAYGAAAFKVQMDGSGFAELHRFSYSGGDGRFPGPLIEGSDGTLYGAAATHRATGGGTVFRINKDGTGYQVLYIMPGEGFGPDEGFLNSNTFSLLEGQDGALYGTVKNNDSVGVAFVFKLNKDGTGFTTLHTFEYTGEGQDALELMQASDGTLYGSVLGDLFKINTDGSGYVRFPTPAQGIGPIGVLTEASDGRMYGMAFTNGYRMSLAIFRFHPATAGQTILHVFPGSGGGMWWQEPRAPLIEGRNGTLFGTTTTGGANNSGTIFRINRDGTGYKSLYDVRATLSFIGTDGAIYGLTRFEGLNLQGSHGTIFRLASDGSGYSELIAFNGDDGAVPTRMLQGRDGAFYGTTLRGGSLNLGTVFALRPRAVFLSPEVLAAGTTIRFTCMPNSAHQLQRATRLSGPWQIVSNLAVPGTGEARWFDAMAGTNNAFYRTVTP